MYQSEGVPFLWVAPIGAASFFFGQFQKATVSEAMIAIDIYNPESIHVAQVKISRTGRFT